MQNEIDKLVAAADEGKAFVRPSGTEDILRLYAEAVTVEEMNHLGNSISDLFKDKFSHFWDRKQGIL